MEYVVHAFSGSVHKGGVPDVSINDVDSTRLPRGGKIVPVSANKVVDYPDLGNSGGQEVIDDGASDEAGSTCYKATRA